ncbi:MAG: tetratricopeptide repeat protein, partial [bacterium]|nr:tetratricopeptide repeat protein [bacterium]
KACDKAIQLKPDYVSAWNNKGVALDKMGRYEEALKACDKAIQLEPDYVYTWNNKGIVLDKMGRHEEAEKAFHRSMEITPEDPYPFFKSTQLLFKLNRRDEGILALDDALSRFSASEKQVADCTGEIVRDLFNGPSDPDLTRTLIEHYHTHSALDALGQGLVRAIAILNAQSLDKAQTWRDTWQELGGKHKALLLPLRLLDAAVRHRETKDPRILLQLPIEERKVLEEILEQTESPEEESN